MAEQAPEKSIIALGPWLETQAGSYVRAWEEARLDELTADIFGFSQTYSTGAPGTTGASGPDADVTIQAGQLDAYSVGLSGRAIRIPAGALDAFKARRMIRNRRRTATATLNADTLVCAQAVA